MQRKSRIDIAIISVLSFFIGNDLVPAPQPGGEGNDAVAAAGVEPEPAQDVPVLDNAAVAGDNELAAAAPQDAESLAAQVIATAQATRTTKTIVTVSTGGIYELYTSAIGVYLCLLIIRATTLATGWIQQGWAQMSEKMKEWAYIVSLSVSTILQDLTERTVVTTSQVSFLIFLLMQKDLYYIILY